MEYLDPVANLLTSTVLTAPDPATTGTTLVIQVADTASFPDPETAGEYNLVVYPAGYEPTRANAEIIRVVSKDSNELTIEREQEGTSARTIIAGDVVAMNITAKMMNDIDAELALKLSDLSAESIGDLDDVDLTSAAEGKILKLNSSGDFVIANDEDTVYTHPNHSGDVTSVADGATTIANSAVTNAKMANMATKTYKGRTAGTTGAPEDVSAATLKSDLSLDNVDNTSDATKNSATATLTNKTIDGDNNTISNLAHGAEVDNPSSGVHGVAGEVVGTTDTQTLSNKTVASPVINTSVSGSAIKDEDNMASDSASHLATQQSIKAYVDSKCFEWEGEWATSTAYVLHDLVENDGSAYVCILGHTSGSTTEPGVGASWGTYWDPLVEKGADAPADGWVSMEETLTRTSDTTFTASGDLTSELQSGDKFKCTQNTVKYFYIVDVSHSGGTTTVTVTGGSDYALVSASITNPYYSKVQTPQGFPTWFNFTVTLTEVSGTFTDAEATGTFMIVGGTVFTNHLITITTNGTATSGYRVSLPLKSAEQRASFYGREYLVVGYMVQGLVQPTTSPSQILVRKYDNTHPGGDGHEVVLNGSYRYV